MHQFAVRENRHVIKRWFEEHTGPGYFKEKYFWGWDKVFVGPAVRIYSNNFPVDPVKVCFSNPDDPFILMFILTYDSKIVRPNEVR